MSAVKSAPRIRFRIAWGAYRKGAIITPPAMERDRLLSIVWYGQRVAELVQEETPPPALPEVVLTLQSFVEPIQESAPVHHDRKRKRGRS